MAIKIVILGSINSDIVAAAERLPSKGETVHGFSVDMFVGGKGANQAVQTALLGTDTKMIAYVGADSQGESVSLSLKANNVDISHVTVSPEFRTGCASIIIDKNGDNMIVHAPGANHAITLKSIDDASAIIKSADVFITQYEINSDAVLYGLKLAHDAGVTTILNPAPAIELSDDLYAYVDYITPNETESEFYTKICRNGLPIEDWKAANAKWFIDRGVKNVCITLGEKGAYFANADQSVSVDAFKIKPVDTTAAGDSFNGGFAYGIANDWDIKKCITFANACGALSAMTLGAQNSIQPMSRVVEFLAGRGISL